MNPDDKNNGKERRKASDRRFVAERRGEAKINLITINIGWVRLILSSKEYPNADVLVKLRDAVPQVGEVMPPKRDKRYYT